MSSHKERLEPIAQSFLNRIGEEVESVLVLATFKDESGNSGSVNWSKGNFYASRGLAQEWLEVQTARVNNYVEREE